MRQVLLIIFLFLSLSAFTQTDGDKKGYVSGTVIGQNDNEPVYSAMVSILQPNDSTFLRGATTDSIGQFDIKINPGKYILTVYFMGYKKYAVNIEMPAEKLNLSLGKILLEDNAIMLGEAVVVGEMPAIVVKGDTIEYNSDAYKPEENAVLRDLLNNIPGLEVDESGNITANGKPVNKILVDGKEFFGNDIPLALANLPANMIKKLQLFKNESESAKITGFKDKEQEQVLNLVVKEELKQSIFGNVVGGYGSDDRYTAKLNTNYMKGETQATLIGAMSNISDSPMYMSSGEDKERNIGTSIYINPIEKMKLGMYLRYSENDNFTESQSNTQTYLEGGDRISKQIARSNNKSDGLNAGFNLSWDIDSLTTIYARSNIRFSKSENDNITQGRSYAEGSTDTTITAYNTYRESDGFSINNSLTAGRKLNSEGRAVSLTLNYSTRDNEDKGTNNSSTEYVGTTTTPPIYIDQKSKTDNKSDSYGFAFSYVEPMGKDNLLQLSYNYNQSKSNRDKNTWKKDSFGNYTVLDSAYTRETDNKNINQSLSLEFQSTKEKYNYTIGFSVDPSSSRSTVHLLDSLIDEVKQNVVNYSPSLRFSYTPTTSSSFDVNYYGNTSQPSSSQLSGDTTIVNASNKYYGNPGLKPSYSNRLDITYQKSDYESGRFMFVSAGFDYTFNNIASYSIIDNLGNTENTYKNVNGNMGANLSFTYNTPLRNKKFTINASTYTYYNRNVGFTNEKKTITNNVVISENLMAKFKSKVFESTMRVGVSFNITKNNLSGEGDRNTSTYTVHNQSTLNLPYDFSFRSDVKYSRYSGYGDDFRKSETLWNVSVAKKFLKEKKGTLRLQFFDILNDRNNLSRTVTSGYSSDTRTNSINRYFMFSFTYQFNIFRGAKSNSDDNTNI